ncbi:MAG: hypothetical protein NTY29_00465, partial [Proteobacteria bacterium]|nr:hypothetical protein [Pseudomonadota bacterium]
SAGAAFRETAEEHDEADEVDEDEESDVPLARRAGALFFSPFIFSYCVIYNIKLDNLYIIINLNTTQILTI